jgi:hypothetical protein
MPKELNEKMIISHETENTDEEREITRKNWTKILVLKKKKLIAETKIHYEVSVTALVWQKKNQ